MRYARFLLLGLLAVVAALLLGSPGGAVAATSAELVKDINPGAGHSDPSGPYRGRLTAVGATGFFHANDGTNGRELWKSDGTAAGTVMIKDINPGAGGSRVGELTDVGGTLFFRADDGTNGRELWKSDGSAAGTVMVKDINPGAGGSSPYNPTYVGGTLFFTADDGTNGQELWKSDGTAAGTVLLKDINPGAGGSHIGELTEVDGILFFRAGEARTNRKLWKSDGTAAGTVMLGALVPDGLRAVGGTLFFDAQDATNGRELWKSDGTVAGTVLVKDINPGAASSNVGDPRAVGGALFFHADDGTSGYELWKSDGTAAGTVLVKDINPGVSSSHPEGLTDVGGTLFFDADDGTNGRELWKTLEVGPPVDIKPGSEPNSINLACHGVIPVAILSTDDFDASTVDPGSVTFAGAAPKKSHLEDVDGDGDQDLILHFKCQQVSIEPAAAEACLQGTTYDGHAFEDCDSVRIVPPESSADSDGDGFTDAAEVCVGTDLLDPCADTPDADDEADDKWPADLNDDQRAALADVLSYIPVFNTFPPSPPSPYDPRYDLNADNGITLADVLSFIPVFNLTCTP